LQTDKTAEKQKTSYMHVPRLENLLIWCFDGHFLSKPELGRKLDL